ncbi:MAG: hypothetical protein KF902_08105 [Phycisphaeraceae bacterium]|nr:hypothetical protein [Phycisphaeraceae bacterium]
MRQLPLARALVIACSVTTLGPLGLLAPTTLSASAQETRREELRQQELLKDFIHYIRIDRADLAKSVGDDLLAIGLSGPEFVDLVESSGETERFTQAAPKGTRMGELEATAAGLLRLYERGLLERARLAEEIAKNIQMLTTTARGKILARERLLTAGEYAMPQLLDALLDRSNPALQAEVSRIVVDLGRQAIIPLATALPGLDAGAQERLVDVMGLINYRTSIPFLQDLGKETANPAVRAACDRAIARLGGERGGSAAKGYAELADAYYQERSELTSFPGEEIQLLWSFDPGLGLVMTGIATPVFHEAMAMRMAERSLTLDPANPEAIALWVASNFSREIDGPVGYDNPAYGANRREAMYYAVAAGADTSQRVLARALDDRDTPLARLAIAAIERTAGGDSLWSGQGPRKPLLEALSYPNRRVQFEAALALASAQPRSGFAGSDRVVPILGGAIREAGTRYAVVLTRDAEEYPRLRGMLETMGYQVAPPAATLAAAATAIAEAAAVDLIVAMQSASSIKETIAESRGNPKLLATPVLGLAQPQDVTDLQAEYSRQTMVAIRSARVADQAITASVEQLVEQASGGPIRADEAQQYASRSIAALRDLAVAGSTVFDVGDATTPLSQALSSTSGELQLRLAEVLARIDRPRAQIAIMDAAVSASGSQRVALLGKVTESARRYGNRIEERQVGRLLQMARSASGSEATAAAGLMGALGLSSRDIVPLLLGE